MANDFNTALVRQGRECYIVRYLYGQELEAIAVFRKLRHDDLICAQAFWEIRCHIARLAKQQATCGVGSK